MISTLKKKNFFSTEPILIKHTPIDRSRRASIRKFLRQLHPINTHAKIGPGLTARPTGPPNSNTSNGGPSGQT